MSESFEKWIAHGERLGLKDEHLQDFVLRKEQEVREREDRARRRAEREKMLLRQQEEEAERISIHELEKLKTQASIEQIKNETEQKMVYDGTHSEFGMKSLRPKLPKFEENKDDMDAFLERLNLEEGIDRGSTFAAYYKEELVVNLWGGSADLKARVPWGEHHLPCFFSTTKIASSVVIAHLVDRGLLDYSQRIKHYWPEFAQNGKENVTLQQLTSNQAGLPVLDEDFPMSLIRDNPTKLAELLAKQKPSWLPGTKHGYHPITFALYLDQIVRRVDRKHRNLAQYFRDEIAVPFDINFHIGLPTEEFYKAPRVVIMKLSNQKLFLENFKGDLDLLNKLYKQPTDFVTIRKMNDPDIRSLPVGSVCGHGTAEGVAKLLGILAVGGVYKGKRLLSETAIKGFEEPLVAGIDVTYGTDLMWGLGSQIMPVAEGNKILMMFGYGGFGGQMAMADTHHKVGFAYVTSHLDTSSRDGADADSRWPSLYHALYQCVYEAENVKDERKTFYKYEDFKMFKASKL